MRHGLELVTLLFIFNAISCKKEDKTNDCFSNTPTVRQIINKQAVVKLTGTVHPVYLAEEGAIDTRLIPCNFPMEFYQHDLQVIISGEVKATPQAPSVPCCAENFVITKISR